MKMLYTTKQLAAVYPAAFSDSSLKKSRMSNTEIYGPPWKNSGSKVFYDHDEVLAWIAKLRPGRAAGGAEIASPSRRKSGGGRPTKAEEIARRQRAA